MFDAPPTAESSRTQVTTPGHHCRSCRSTAHVEDGQSVSVRTSSVSFFSGNRSFEHSTDFGQRWHRSRLFMAALKSPRLRIDFGSTRNQNKESYYSGSLKVVYNVNVLRKNTMKRSGVFTVLPSFEDRVRSCHWWRRQAEELSGVWWRVPSPNRKIKRRSNRIGTDRLSSISYLYHEYNYLI